MLKHARIELHQCMNLLNSGTMLTIGVTLTTIDASVLAARRIATPQSAQTHPKPQFLFVRTQTLRFWWIANEN